MLEVLVSIGIISMLMALLLPAVQQAREAGRRNTCANNVRNLGVAMSAEADTARRYPPSGYYPDNSKSKTQPAPSWVVTLLPRIERSDISAIWRRDLKWWAAANQALAETHIDVLCCPDDVSLGGQGDLSYAVNASIGFTAQVGGIDNCPLAPSGGKIDLNSEPSRAFRAGRLWTEEKFRAEPVTLERFTEPAGMRLRHTECAYYFTFAMMFAQATRR